MSTIRAFPHTLLACCSLMAGAGGAGAVELDPSWGIEGKTIVGFDYVANGMDMATGSAMGESGEMYIAGTVTDANGRHRMGVTKLGVAGKVDESFGVQGRVVSPEEFGQAEARAGVVLHDGVLYVGGFLDLAELGSEFALCAFTLGGEPKPFEVSGRACISLSLGDGQSVSYDVATAIAAQPDGKLVLAGSSSAAQSSDRYAAFARFDPSGAPDAGFGPDATGGMRLRSAGFDQHELEDLALASNGKLVAVGATRRSGQIHYDALVVRLEADGSPDANGFAQECAFATTQGMLATKLSDLALIDGGDGDDRIVAVGTTQYNMVGQYGAMITEVSADDCSLEDTFGAGGYQVMTAGGDLGYSAIVRDPGAGYVVAGTFEPTGGNPQVFAAHYYGTDWLQFPTMHFAESSKDWLVDLHVLRGGIYISGWTFGADSNRDFAAARFGIDRIFADSFGDPVSDI